LTRLSAYELEQAYRARSVSPVEVMTAVLNAVNARKEYNAFCCVDAERAMQAARSSQQRWQAGQPLSAFDGVPVSIKDNVGVEGMPTRFGSLASDEAKAFIPDSPSVARLREAGALLFGKTTLPDFAHKITTDSPLTGTTSNPWNSRHTPGGSSGGAAAAIASGIGPIAIGTDGGGSIRIPAAFCGNFGFKPSFGRVPHYPRGAFGLLSHVGPMTRTVRDAAAIMNILVKPDVRDGYALPFEDTDYSQAMTPRADGLRVACSIDLGLDRAVASELQQVVRRSSQFLEKLGAQVEEASPPAMQECIDVHRVLWATFCERLAASLGDKVQKLDPSLTNLVEAGKNLPREAFIDSLIRRGELGRQVGEFFSKHDVLLCPVHPTTAPALSEIDASFTPYPVFTQWCNQVGLPAASVNCGVGANGLPLAVQVVGPRFADKTVLRVSQMLESAWGASALAPLAALA
jgi:aspartyl-tRNA(Asn)/glutamyl-tRNA(Gln) amidotransferase subunit A